MRSAHDARPNLRRSYKTVLCSVMQWLLQIVGWTHGPVFDRQPQDLILRKHKHNHILEPAVTRCSGPQSATDFSAFRFSVL